MDEKEDTLKRNIWEFIAPYLIERAKKESRNTSGRKMYCGMVVKMVILLL